MLYQTQWCYNWNMTRDYFAQYAKQDPKGYKVFSDSVWNAFVSVTHKIGLSNYFSFTPPEMGGAKSQGTSNNPDINTPNTPI